MHMQRWHILLLVVFVATIAVSIGIPIYTRYKRRSRNKPVFQSTTAPLLENPAAMPDDQYQRLVKVRGIMSGILAQNSDNMDKVTRDNAVTQLMDAYAVLQDGLKKPMSSVQRTKLNLDNLENKVNQFRGVLSISMPVMTDTEATDFLRAFLTWRDATDKAQIQQSAQVMVPLLKKQISMFQVDAVPNGNLSFSPASLGDSTKKNIINDAAAR